MLKDPGLAETTYSKIRGCRGAFHNITTPYLLSFHVEELLERDNCRRDWERLEKERAALRPVPRRTKCSPSSTRVVYLGLGAG